GRIGDGFMSVTATTPERLAREVALVAEGLERAGRDADDVTLSLVLPTFAWPNDPWRTIVDHAHHMAWSYEHMLARPVPGDRAAPPPPTPADVARLRAGETAVGD